MYVRGERLSLRPLIKALLIAAVIVVIFNLSLKAYSSYYQKQTYDDFMSSHECMHVPDIVANNSYQAAIEIASFDYLFQQDFPAWDFMRGAAVIQGLNEAIPECYELHRSTATTEGKAPLFAAEEDPYPKSHH